MKIEYGTYDVDTRIEIAEVNTFDEMRKVIKNFLEARNQKVSYSRINFIPKCWQFDYGSHVYFFWISDLPENAQDLFMGEYA